MLGYALDRQLWRDVAIQRVDVSQLANIRALFRKAGLSVEISGSFASGLTPLIGVCCRAFDFGIVDMQLHQALGVKLIVLLVVYVVLDVFADERHVSTVVNQSGNGPPLDVSRGRATFGIRRDCQQYCLAFPPYVTLSKQGNESEATVASMTLKRG